MKRRKPKKKEKWVSTSTSYNNKSTRKGNTKNLRTRSRLKKKLDLKKRSEGTWRRFGSGKMPRGRRSKTRKIRKRKFVKIWLIGESKKKKRSGRSRSRGKEIMKSIWGHLKRRRRKPSTLKLYKKSKVSIKNAKRLRIQDNTQHKSLEIDRIT